MTAILLVLSWGGSNLQLSVSSWMIWCCQWTICRAYFSFTPYSSLNFCPFCILRLFPRLYLGCRTLHKQTVAAAIFVFGRHSSFHEQQQLRHVIKIFSLPCLLDICSGRCNTALCGICCTYFFFWMYNDIDGRLAPLATLVDEDADLDSMITHFNKAVTDTAAELLDKQRQKRKPWVTPEILDLCDQRRDPKKKRGEPEGAKDYREIKRKIRTEMKMTKETWIHGQCHEVEACLRKNNSKKAYQLVNDLTTEKQGKSTTTQNKSGKCLTRENEILNRWTEYCSDLYNYETEGDPIVLDCPQIPDEEHHLILRDEVEAAVKALKMGKSAGVDNILAELVQAGEATIDILTTICNKISKTGEWPTTWTQSLVTTLPRKTICSCARITETSALSAIPVRSCWRSS